MISAREMEKYCEENFGQCELIKVVKHSPTFYTLKCSEICDSDLNLHLKPLEVSLLSNNSHGGFYAGFINSRRHTTSATVKLSAGLVHMKCESTWVFKRSVILGRTYPHR